MKKILYAFICAFIGGLILGFKDGMTRNRSGRLEIFVVRGFGFTLLVAGGFIARSVIEGESIGSAALRGNKIILSFFVGYFTGAILSVVLLR